VKIQVEAVSLPARGAQDEFTLAAIAADDRLLDLLGWLAVVGWSKALGHTSPPFGYLFMTRPANGLPTVAVMAGSCSRRGADRK
jgi:hypothetical protein